MIVRTCTGKCLIPAHDGRSETHKAVSGWRRSPRTKISMGGCCRPRRGNDGVPRRVRAGFAQPACWTTASVRDVRGFAKWRTHAQPMCPRADRRTAAGQSANGNQSTCLRRRSGGSLRRTPRWHARGVAAAPQKSAVTLRGRAHARGRAVPLRYRLSRTWRWIRRNSPSGEMMNRLCASRLLLLPSVRVTSPPM